jgi:hypothetical protein
MIKAIKRLLSADEQISFIKCPVGEAELEEPIMHREAIGQSQEIDTVPAGV